MKILGKGYIRNVDKTNQIRNKLFHRVVEKISDDKIPKKFYFMHRKERDILGKKRKNCFKTWKFE